MCVNVCVELGAVWERHKHFNGEAQGLQDEAFGAAAWQPWRVALRADQMQGEGSLLHLYTGTYQLFCTICPAETFSASHHHYYTDNVSHTSVTFSLAIRINTDWWLFFMRPGFSINVVCSSVGGNNILFLIYKIFFYILKAPFPPKINVY